MQWLTADIVFDGYDFHADFYLQVDETGRVISIQKNKPDEPITKYDGLLMPGMVNAHCHLELSHTKGLIAEKTGLPTFLQNVSKQIPQKVDEAISQNAMLASDAEMQKNGIVAVGDICNTAKSIAVKSKTKMRYHNFVECIAIKEADSQKRFDEYFAVYKKFLSANLSGSLALHTPYTCNEGMFKLVNEHSDFISIHNQESAAENLLFEKREGDFDTFYKHFGLDKSSIIKEESCSSSFQNSQRLFGFAKKKLFIHNTFTSQSDLEFTDANSWFCFCPKANLYIENQLPNIPIFLDFQDRIVLGTDSLASNDALNILSEVKTIQDHFPNIPLNNILQWATINGARLLGLEKEIGSFEEGKKPSFVHLTEFDIEGRKLTNKVVSYIFHP